MGMHIGWLSDSADLPAILAGAAGKDMTVSHYDSILLAADECDLVCADSRHGEASSLCRQRLSNTGVAAILLGELDSEERSAWIKSGADDAVHLSWGADELAMRIRAAVRKAHLARGLWRHGPLTFKLLERTVCCGGKRVPFNMREYALLLYLARANGKTVCREELFKNVWGLDFDPGTNRIEVYMFRLRKKLRRHKAARLVQTVKGRGYRLNID